MVFLDWRVIEEKDQEKFDSWWYEHFLVTWSDPVLLRLFSCGSAGFRDDSEVVRGFWVESWDGGDSGGGRLWLDGAEVRCDAEFGLRWAWELWALHLDIKALKIQWYFYYELICKNTMTLLLWTDMQKYNDTFIMNWYANY